MEVAIGDRQTRQARVCLRVDFISGGKCRGCQCTESVALTIRFCFATKVAESRWHVPLLSSGCRCLPHVGGAVGVPVLVGSRGPIADCRTFHASISRRRCRRTSRFGFVRICPPCG